MLLVAMYRIRGKGWQADGDILGAVRKWSGITDPLAAMRDNGLPGGYIKFSGFMMHAQRSPQDDCVLVKFRSLSGFFPACGTTHVGNAHGGGGCVDASGIFVNDLRFVASGFDARGMRDESRHGEAS